jgi:hypothetical protein
VAIDRQTHDSDVMERVLGVDSRRDDENMRTEVIDLAIQPWLAVEAVSAIVLSIGYLGGRRGAPRRRR